MTLVPAPIRQLARLYGIQSTYDDFAGRRRASSRDAVLAAVRQLGAHVHGPGDVEEAIRARRLEQWREILSPVIVVAGGRRGRFDVRLPAPADGVRLGCLLRLEDGTTRRWRVLLAGGDVRESVTVGRRQFVRARVALPSDLPVGYHWLTVERGGKNWQSFVIRAPARAWASADRVWGAFLPLHALYSRRSWGAGDLSDLARLQRWIGTLGGHLVSVLPLLSAFLDEPFDPSPYAPVSRLFWNEFYVDPRFAPELAACPRARQLMASPGFRRQLASLRSSTRVDYRQLMSLKRQVLEALAATAHSAAHRETDSFRRYVATHPSLRDYAAFRAITATRKRGWSEWPARLAAGSWRRSDCDPDAYRYHLYVQWLCHRQLQAATADSTARLYLDLPLGVHRQGYDPWRHRELFATDVSGGAPPDDVFTRGQDWAFPPLRPDALRKQHYRYFIDCLRHQLAHAAVMRIDHVMGLHRLYWIPKGLPATDGVYVRYPADELYAILCCESHRHRAAIVGENLGTVPAYVNQAMGRHGVQQMYVVQYEAGPLSKYPLRPAPAASVASLNTHDMPPFAAYLRGIDIDDRATRGLLAPSQVGRTRATRRTVREALAGFFYREGAARSASTREGPLVASVLRWLGTSAARTVLVNLEDLWLETRSQNEPGTGLEQLNWTRRARFSLEQFATRPAVIGPLRELARGRPGPPS